MSEYIRQQADKHTVKHESSGKLHFFEVTSGNSGKKYSVSIKINCDCAYTSIKGQANATMCSHVLAVLREIINRADIQIIHSENIMDKRNACKQLVRSGENMTDITEEQLRKGIQKAKETGISPDVLLIPRPKLNTINICGIELYVTPNHYLCTVEGIEIHIDEKMPKDKAYLIDSKTMVLL